MGGLFTCNKNNKASTRTATAPSYPTNSSNHQPGHIYNIKLDDSSIAELRSLRIKVDAALREQGESEVLIDAELKPLDEEINRREKGPVPIQ
jgi:hypothetical protein